MYIANAFEQFASIPNNKVGICTVICLEKKGLHLVEGIWILTVGVI